MAQHPDPSSLIGTIIADRYLILDRVGEGGMGQVYLAEHVKMKRKSAIKVMRPALVDDAEALQRFSREAENASKLSHPNVASIFDFGETNDGIVYLAMEFIEGESLHATLEREKALHPQVAADIIGQAADALQAAHDLGILHRDLKPDNLMLTMRADGTFLVKLVDFGIARTIDSTVTRVTRTGFAVGTPEYMSPEQLSGDELDARSDQYALALVAFATLTGEEAFADATGKDSLILRLTSRPRRLADVRPDIDWPVTLQSVFDRALAPEANDRYDTIAEFADDLSVAIGNMTATETAEIYSRAMMGRSIGGGSRRTPALDQPTVSRASARNQAFPTPREAPRAQVIGLPDQPRGKFFPTVIVLSLAVYGTYWYGSRQPEGTARDIANTIGAITTTVTTPIKPFIDKLLIAAGGEPKVEEPKAKPATPPARRPRPEPVKRDTTAPAASVPDTTATAAPTRPPVAVPPDSASPVR